MRDMGMDFATDLAQESTEDGGTRDPVDIIVAVNVDELTSFARGENTVLCLLVVRQQVGIVEMLKLGMEKAICFLNRVVASGNEDLRHDGRDV